MITLTKQQAIEAVKELNKKFPQYSIEQICTVLSIEVAYINVKEIIEETA